MDIEDKLAFLDTEEPEANESAETPAEPDTPVEQPEVEEKGERPRDEHGKFVKAEEPKPEPVMVPLAALHETRDKVRDLEARLAASQQPAQQPEEPDIFVDQKGYTEHLRREFNERLYDQTLAISGRFAVQQHGKEAVAAAVEWGKQRCAVDPHFNAQVFASPDPIGFAVEQHQREQIASQVDPGEFQKFQAWQAAQAQAQQPPAQQQEQPQTPPASIASLPSSGGAAHVPTGPGQAFDTLFTR